MINHKNGETIFGLDIDCFETFNENVNQLLSEQSDRAKIIMTAAWIDMFLEVKLRNEFSKGNSAARRALFGKGESFSLSAKLNIAYCAGWIDDDVYHDANIIRKLRNKYAHEIAPLSLDDEKYSNLLESLRVPQRQYIDWGNVQVSTTDKGIIIYTGDKPSEAREDYYIPGTITFKLAIPVVLAVLLANLDIPLVNEKMKLLYRVRLPEYMNAAESCRSKPLWVRQFEERSSATHTN